MAGEAAAAPGNIGRVVRRVEFDHAMARATAARGVCVREGVRVLQVLDDGEAAVVETSEGPIRARIVVGCDGVGSVARRALGIGAGSLRAQVVEVDTEPAPADRDRGLIHFDASDPRVVGYTWDFPTLVGGRELVCRGVYRIRFDGERPDAASDVGAILDERLRAIGVDPKTSCVKRYAERGFESAACVARGRVMLVGESAGIDPSTGEGIAQAIEYGVLAGGFLARVGRAGGALHVDAWAREVRDSRLARDMRVRARFMRLFHGPGRAPMERLLTRSPDLLHLCSTHFGAQRRDWRRIGRVARRAAIEVAASLLP